MFVGKVNTKELCIGDGVNVERTCLSQDEVIDKYKLQMILEKGYSRIPVYVNKDKNDIIGRFLYLIIYRFIKN